MSPAPLVSIEIEPRSLRLRKPLVTAHGTLEGRDVWIVRLHDADGRVGIGEAAPMSSVGTENRRVCAESLYRLNARQSFPVEDWEDALRALLPTAPAARAGVDAALWDLAAQRADQPLALLLRGESPPDSVPVNALVSDAASARDALRAGYGVLKAKITSGDRTVVDAIREAGPGAELRLDANGCFPHAAAAREALLGFEGISLLEQPVPAADVDGLCVLRGKVPMQLAADESIIDEAAGRRLIDAGAVDVLVLKPARLGGLGPCLRLTAAARAAGLDAYVTTILDGAVGRTAALHLAAAIHRLGGPAHGLSTGPLLADDIASVPAPRHGALAVPTAPGLGVVA